MRELEFVQVTPAPAFYVSYDSGRLYFPDGSFWTFGSASAGTEEDPGTMYPTLMEDSLFRCPNSSAIEIRIQAVLGRVRVVEA
jgi:hypothetical protein